MPDVFINPTETEPTAEEVAEKTTPAPIAGLPNGVNIAHPTPIHGLSSYKEMPEGVTFDTQEDNETILLFLRMAFITNVPWIVATILLIIAPIIVSVAIRVSHSPFQFFPTNFVLIIQVLYYLIVATYIFVNFITWYFNISLITDKRVIDVDFADLIYKNVAGTKLDLVQDVSFEQVGGIRAIFNYGDVLIQTAGTVDNFALHAVPRPERVVEIVEALLGRGRNAT